MKHGSTRLVGGFIKMDEGSACAANSKRRRRTLYCGHCLEEVSKSTYYRHREKYYDEVEQRWSTLCSDSSTEESELECKLQ